MINPWLLSAMFARTLVPPAVMLVLWITYRAERRLYVRLWLLAWVFDLLFQATQIGELLSPAHFTEPLQGQEIAWLAISGVLALGRDMLLLTGAAAFAHSGRWQRLVRWWPAAVAYAFLAPLILMDFVLSQTPLYVALAGLNLAAAWTVWRQRRTPPGASDIQPGIGAPLLGGTLIARGLLLLTYPLVRPDAALAPIDFWLGAALSFVLASGMILVTIEDARGRVEELYAMTRRLLAESESLQATSAALAENLELEDVLAVICDQAQQLIGAAGSCVLLPEEEPPAWLRAAAARGTALSVQGLQVPLDGSLAGLAFMTGRPQLSREPWHDTRAYRMPIEMINTRSLLVFPLSIRSRTVGVISLFDKQFDVAEARVGPQKQGGATRDAFDDDDIRLLRQFASQAALAIENAGLFRAIERSEEQYRRLTEDASDVIFALDSNSRLTFASRRLHEVTGYNPEELLGESFADLIAPASREVVAEHMAQLLSDPTYQATFSIEIQRRDGEIGYLEVAAVPQLVDGRIAGVQGIARDVTERVHLEHEVARRTHELRLSEERRSELQSYAGLVTRILEEERKRLARELHDDTAQSLILIARQVDEAEELIVEAPAAAAEELERVHSLVEATAQSVRRFARDLRPPLLDRLGLAAALNSLVEQTGAGSGVEVRFEVTGRPRRLTPEVELTLYRLAQEGLTNVRKHAHANHVRMDLGYDSTGVRLSISDDGQGFTLRVGVEAGDGATSAVGGVRNGGAPPGGMGLIGMQERAELIGATLSIQSILGQGTTVVVEVSDRVGEESDASI